MAEKDSMQKKETGTRNADFSDKKIKKTKFIVCLTGMPGSGKSTVAESLKKKGFSVIAMGDEMLSNNNLTVEVLQEKAVGIVQKWVGEFYNDDGIRNNKGRQ